MAAMAISLGAAPVSAAEPAFPDMAGHWAESYVGALAKKQIVSGMGDGLFHPEALVTTEQFVAMLTRASVGAISPTSESWASGYMEEASRRSVIDAVDKESAGAPLVRRFAARIAHNALLYMWDEADAPDIYAATALSDLYDCDTCVWHVGQMYVKGIMLGTPGGEFRGDGNLSRAEAAAVIMRLIDSSLRAPQKAEFPGPAEDGKITPEDARQLLDVSKSVALIDVRTKEEYDNGHIPGSENISVDDIVSRISETKLPTNKDAIIIIYCQKGARALKARSALKKAGYTKVYNLGGIEDWPYEIERR